MDTDVQLDPSKPFGGVEACPRWSREEIHGPHEWNVVNGDETHHTSCPGWWPNQNTLVGPMIGPDYVPVDTSFEARQDWPEMHFSEPQLNARELGQFISGVIWGESCSTERRAWRVQVPNDKVAGVVAAIVDRGFSVAKEWGGLGGESVTKLAVWSGL